MFTLLHFFVFHIFLKYISFPAFFLFFFFSPCLYLKILLDLEQVHFCCIHINFAFIKCLHKIWSLLILQKKIPLNTLSGILNYVHISIHMIVLLLELTARKSFIFSEERRFFLSDHEINLASSPDSLF